MSKLKRLWNIFVSLLMIACAVLMVYETDIGYRVVLIILAASLEVAGIKDLIYYFTMTRNMVGGKMVLFKGAILFDFGCFTATLTDVPGVYVIVYLLVIHAFSGLIEILRARESRKIDGKWKLKFFHGILNFAIVLVCIVYINRPAIAVYVYAAGLVYSAILRVVTAFRRSAVVYIQ